ncbi:valyl-tRNA synthase [Candidatus Magnetoovum chiemensis]|nr:valyl-tRNA synthase [Candidatus Magnetoovum chiemensis]
MKKQIKELEKTYIPEDIENKWYDYWLKEGIFEPSKDSSKPSFSIVIPPPNVTGSLHMGHALNATIQDILSRWKRMKGYKVLWLPGTDHAGIATQNVVEKDLAKEGKTRHDIGRDAFIERTWKWKKEYGGRIIHQLKKLAASCDWTKERFTLDEGLSSAVKEVFLSLFEKGLIYRSLRLINWCPRCHTALSDLEVEHEELKGALTYIKYPIEAVDNFFIVVATTRPETMLGDTAVAVNPDDERYKGLLGRMVKLPLTDRLIPIIYDSAVDKTFGSGAVKVTPAHDFNDEAMAKRQQPNLQFITVIGPDGRMTDEAGKDFANLDRYHCREKVIEQLKEQGLILKIAEHNHSIAHCYRCKTIIEPLPIAQWYVDVKNIAQRATQAVRDGKIRIIPQWWDNSFYAWMDDIKDWCISRQIWWGHQIPAWYCADCKTPEGKPNGEDIHHELNCQLKGVKEGSYSALRQAGLTKKEILENSKTIKIGINVKPFVSKDQPHKCPVCQSDEIIQDPDVLDTWFSSALWPFSTLGWPDKTKDLKDFYPTSVLVTAFDILFFWVARMIMMGLEFMDEAPFKDVYIHALIRDAKGDKMSKSKGNVIDPLVIIDKFGTDAFRFSLAAFAAQGRDIRFSEERVEGYRFFINKLWNATRFIFMNLDGADLLKSNTIEDINREILEIDKETLSLPNKWIIARLSETAQEINKSLDEYRLNDASSAIYQFVWHEFCDWYIEFTKTAFNKDKDNIEQTRKCLLFVLDNSLRLLHPFMPFVTEELWNTMPHELNTISLTSYPEGISSAPKEQQQMQDIIDAISGIRSIKGELNISPSKRLKVYMKPFNSFISANLVKHKDYITDLAKLDHLEIDTNMEKPKGSAVSIKRAMEIYVPLSGLLNTQGELDRLEKEITKLSQSITALDKKLLNLDFLDKAPKEVVDKEKTKYEELITKKKKIAENISKLKQLKETEQ